MALGKETPRQKMIGMMYLVLTCLLAMNVSKDILKGFITVNENLERTNKNFTENTTKLMDGMKAAIDNGHPEVKHYYEKSIEAHQLTEQMIAYIGQLKSEVQQYTEDVPGADTMRLRFIEKQDDYDKPTYFFIGDDETKPKSGAFSARELREKLNGLSTELIKMVDKMYTTNGTRIPEEDYKTLRKKIEQLKPVDPNEKENDVPVTWEIQNFNQLPLAAVITNLSKMQSDVHNIESEMIGVFAAASGKLAIRFDTLRPCVIAKADYVQLGQPYNADVFLAASSSEFKSENLQMFLGEIDKSTGQPLPATQTLPIETGSGKIQLPTNTVGHHTYKGVIKLKDANGYYKYFDFEKEYTVAPVSVAVSADKMNVFYAGVPNPISVSAAGFAPQDVQVSISGCGGRLTALGNGKYEVMVSSPGNCEIRVSAKINNELKPQGQPIVFRVKPLPVPMARAAGVSGNGTLEVPLADIRSLGGVGVDLSGFPFQTTFLVTEFDIYVPYRGVTTPFHCTGNQLSTDAKQAIIQCPRGSRIFIDDIKARGPDKTYKLAAMTLRAK